MRELASYLAMAVFVVDPSGELVFYNEPAELLLGTRFDETGPMLMDDWWSMFEPSDEQGHPGAGAPAPRHRRGGGPPGPGPLLHPGLDGARRQLEVTAIPLLGQSGRRLGAAAVFWEATA